MIDAQTSKILKFIAKHQPCSFEKIEDSFNLKYEDSPHLLFINVNHLIYKTASLPDGKPLIALTPKGKSALEEYQRASNAIIIAIISISISFLIFLKPPDFNIVDTFNRFTQWLFENLQFLLCSHTFF